MRVQTGKLQQETMTPPISGETKRKEVMMITASTKARVSFALIRMRSQARFTSVPQLICRVLYSETSDCNYAGKEDDQTIVTTDECIPIPICHSPIYVLLRLLKGDVHVSIKARQYT